MEDGDARGGGGGGGMRELEELLNIKDGKVVGALQCEPDERRQRADAIDRAKRADAAVAAACLACPDRRVGAAAAGCRYAGASATPSRWRRVVGAPAPPTAARRRRARALGSARPPAGCVRGFDDLVTELVSDAVGR